MFDIREMFHKEPPREFAAQLNEIHWRWYQQSFIVF